MNVFRKIGIIKGLMPFNKSSLRFKKNQGLVRNWIVQFFGMISIITANTGSSGTGLFSSLA